MTDQPNWAAPGGRPHDPPAGWQPPPGGPGPGYPPPGYPPPGYGPPGHGPGTSAPRPGIIPLRPLGLGEILDGAISYIRRNPAATLGLAAAVAVVTQVAGALVQLPLLSVDASSIDSVGLTGLIAGTGLATLVTLALTLVGTAVLTGMLVAVLGDAVLGRTATLGQTWARVRGRVPGLVGMSLLVGLAVVAILVVAVLPGVLASFAGGQGGAIALSVLGGLVGVVAAAWVSVRWALAAPVYVLESRGVLQSLGRSAALVRGRWWRTFGILLLTAILAAIVANVLAVPFTFGGAALAAGDGSTLALGLVLTTIGGIIVSTLTTPFVSGVAGLLYVDQRIRKEGFDLELARSAGR